MAENVGLKNSRRILEKVTYTPVKLAEVSGGGALEIALAFRGMNVIPGEATAAGQLVEEGPRSASLELLEKLVSGATASERLEAASNLALKSTQTLVQVVGLIRKQRQDRLDDLIALLGEIVAKYKEALQNQEEENKIPVPAMPPLPVKIAEKLGKALASQVAPALVWAEVNEAASVAKLLVKAADVIPPGMRPDALTVLYLGIPFLMEQTPKNALVEGHLTSRKLQPAGLLHLEQLVTTPLEIERGELIYSLPLAPYEKVTVSHKEWTLREEEYTRFVQDYMESYSERGVAQATDIAVSSRSETEHTKTLSMNKPIAPGGATLADPVAMSNDVTTEKQSLEQSRRDTRAVTEKASTLAIRDQKISFTVATTSGTEDFTARLYENKTDDKVMLIEYFRRMRRWRNDLYRVGLRMTYDVVLPDPGRRLRERWMQVKELDAQIAAPFEFTLGVKSPFAATMNITVAAAALPFATVFSSEDDFDRMTPEQLDLLARQYGTTIEPAPETLTSVEQLTPVKGTPGQATEATVMVPIPDGYRPTKVRIGGRLATEPGDAKMVGDYWGHKVDIGPDEVFTSAPFDVKPQHFASKSISAGFIAYNGAVGEARLKVELTPTVEKMRTWRSTVWQQLRQAALARYNEKRETLRQKRTALFSELDAPDTLALRRMEREQIMYLVLEWLFPEFGKSAEVAKSLAGSGPTAWETVLEYGEYIKFVHDSIDWDRILIILYPYFWGSSAAHADKLYLHHPDGSHREFLRAGAARVILAIKPGYESDVVALLDQGKLGGLAPASRFEGLIDKAQSAEKEFREMRAPALAPFEDGEDVAARPAVPGALIGQWHDYTPTSALDADVTLKPLLP